ncbi:MAG: methyl-accepting chemotaxis protein [Azoarcus sp.]|nr:methyl-accepting chemotaxis protein [Azoarcus sp.]
MNVVNNAPIRVKLLVPLALITVMLIAISVIGVTRLDLLNDKVDEMSSRYMDAQSALLAADRDLQQALVAERSILSVEAGSDFFETFEAAHRENVDQAYAGVARYAELMGDETAATASTEFARLAKVWEETSLGVIDTMRTGTLSDAVAAMASSVYKGEPEFNTARDILDGEQERLDAVLDQYSEEAEFAYESAFAMLVAASLIGIVICVLVGAFLPGTIARPIREISRVLSELATGNGDLTRRMPDTRKDEIGELARYFNHFMDNLQTLVRQVSECSDQVSSASSELSATATGVANSSQAQSESAASTAAAVEEITVSISSVAQGAEEVLTLSREGMQLTGNSNRGLKDLLREVGRVENAVKEIAAAVQEFVRSSQAITNMTKQVKDMADQTNLLALNAAIEAARAGEHGRGFAVVADEVRKLAEKSGHAASEIDVVTRTLGEQSEGVEKSIELGLTSLASSQEQVGRVVELLEEATSTVERAVGGVGEITSSVKEQTAASNDIARNVENIAQMAEQNSEAVRETSEAAHHLENLAATLRTLVGRFRV